MSTRRKWLGRTVAVLVAVGFVVVLAALAARQWVIPAYIRKLLVDEVSQVWDGPVTVRGVRFSYFGPIEIAGMGMEDPQGRQWLQADGVSVRLGRWPGLSPTIADIEVDRLDVQLRESPPVRPVPDVEPDVFETLDALGILRVRVRHLSVGLRHGREYVNLEPMRLALDRQSAGYGFLLEALPPHQHALASRGRLDSEDGRFQAYLDLDRYMAEGQYRLVRGIVGGDWPVTDASAGFAGTLELSGSLLRDPRLWDVRLEGRVDDGSAELSAGVSVDNLSAGLLLRDGRLQVSDAVCDFAGGRAEAQARVDWNDGRIGYEAAVSVEELNAASATAAMGLDLLRTGTLDGTFDLSGSDTEARIRGAGELRAEPAAEPVSSVGGAFDFDIRWPPTSDTRPGPQGRVELAGWHVSAERPLAENLTAAIDIDGRNIDIASASAETMGGSADIRGRVVLPEEWSAPSAGLDVAVNIDGINTEKAAELLGRDIAVPAGRFSTRSGVSGHVGEVTRLETTGETSFETADVRHITGSHELEFSLSEDDRWPSVAGRLADWTWTEAGRELAKLHQVYLDSRDDEVRVSEAVIETPGGTIEAGGRLGPDERGAVEHRWEVSLRQFDPVALLPEPDETLPVAGFSMEGVVSGVGTDILTAEFHGNVDARWADEEIEYASGLSVHVSLGDLLAEEPADRLMATIRPSRGVVRIRGERLVTGLGGQVRLEGTDPGRAMLAGESAGGTFEADLRLTMPEGRFAYEGNVDIRDGDLSRLPEWLARRIDAPRTSIRGSFLVVGDEFDSIAINGAGSAAMRIDADDEWSAAGNYEIQIGFGQPDAEEQTRPLGTARLTDWSVSNSRGMAAENIRCSVHIFGRSLDVGGIRADLMGGTAFGVLRLDFVDDEPMVYRGRFRSDGIKLSAIARFAGAAEDDVAGKMNLSYAFAGRGLSPDDLLGRGTISIRDSMMVGVPLMQAILTAIEVRPAAAENTDLDLAFSNVAETVTLAGGRMGTPLVAVSPMPGGTVNMQTGELDLHVVAAILDDLERLMDVPILDIFVPFTRHLTRLHVTGTWHSRETIAITKHPIRDVGEATLRFFRDVVETGGDLGAIVAEPLHEVLR